MDMLPNIPYGNDIEDVGAQVNFFNWPDVGFNSQVPATVFSGTFLRFDTGCLLSVF